MINKQSNKQSNKKHVKGEKDECIIFDDNDNKEQDDCIIFDDSTLRL